VTEEGKNTAIKHYKISRTGDAYMFGTQVFDSIDTLMKESKKFINLTTPAHGSKFSKLAIKYPACIKPVKKKEDTIVNIYAQAGGDQDFKYEPAQSVRKFEKPVRGSNDSDSDSTSSDVPLHRKKTSDSDSFSSSSSDKKRKTITLFLTMILKLLNLILTMQMKKIAKFLLKPLDQKQIY